MNYTLAQVEHYLGQAEVRRLARLRDELVVARGAQMEGPAFKSLLRSLGGEQS